MANSIILKSIIASYPITITFFERENEKFGGDWYGILVGNGIMIMGLVLLVY